MSILKCGQAEGDIHCLVSGFIKWFDFKNNYGFVTTKKDKKDVFLHYSGISPLIPESYWPTLLVSNQVSYFTGF